MQLNTKIKQEKNYVTMTPNKTKFTVKGNKIRIIYYFLIIC